MVFFKNVRAIFDSSVRSEALIETQVDSFRRYMNACPERDKHTWLAMTLKSRYPNLDGSSYYTETWQFSILSITDAPVALGIYLINKEGPTSAIPYSERFLKIMSPVWDLVTKKSIIEKTYSSENLS